LLLIYPFKLIHSFIHSKIYIAPLQGNYSEAFIDTSKKLYITTWLHYLSSCCTGAYRFMRRRLACLR